MAIVVVSPQLEAACTEMWADPADVAVLLDNTEADAETATIEATWVLWMLSGQKYHGYQCWTQDYLLTPGQPKFTFDKAPVDEIISISLMEGTSISGEAGPLEGWTWDGRYVHMSDCSSRGWPWERICGECSDVKVRVRYRIKPWLPPGTDRVVTRLASEYWKASTNDSSCKLPDRIQTVSRQGVSWTLLDPQDFLQWGRTGIGPIDSWIATTNRFGITRVIDPYYAPTVVYSEQTGCGADCT